MHVIWLAHYRVYVDLVFQIRPGTGELGAQYFKMFQMVIRRVPSAEFHAFLHDHVA